MDHHTGDKWLIHDPKTQQGQSVANPETPLLISHNMVCESDIEDVNGKLSNPLFKLNVHEQES